MSKGVGVGYPGHLNRLSARKTMSGEASSQDAECLLQFASETGIAVDEVTKKAVLDARAAFAKDLDEPTTANLLTALSKLARMVSPVTPASLRVSPQR